VEQKNWSAVRRLVGYDRYTSREALGQLNRVYQLARYYVNFFQPTMQLQHKSRHGAKVHKVYDVARTPYRRLLASGVLAREQQDALAIQYQRLNPVRLLAHINQALEQLWEMATTTPSHEPSVTSSTEAA
jgi:uncharacterized protein with von Willebrand factor type A (vWA) domain|tara:strand:- start:402 stop:791 length:390 start_codon:yes stop_codon:yes gene_type:complete